MLLNNLKTIHKTIRNPFLFYMTNFISLQNSICIYFFIFEYA